MKAAARMPIAARVKAAARTKAMARVEAAAQTPIAARARMKIRIATARGEKKRKFPKRKSLNFACRFCLAGQDRHAFISFILTFLGFFPGMLFFFEEETTAFRVRFLLCSREKFGLVKP